MTIVTKNSTYRVDPEGARFRVTKIAAQNPRSTFMTVGEWKLTECIEIQVGKYAEFDDWSTSTVVEVLP